MDLANFSFGKLLSVDSNWMITAFLIIFVSLLLDFSQKRIIKRLKGKALATKNLWDDSFLEAVAKPLSVAIWVVGITFAAQVIDKQAQTEVLTFISRGRDVAVIIIIAWFLVRFINQVETNLISGHFDSNGKVDTTTADAISKLLRVSVIITAVLVVLQNLGYSISGVLAFGGIGGVVVGFAAKDLLSNFFGGLMIYLDRPFKVGDWIRSPDRDIEGTVEKIGWRLTSIRTFDKRPLYVPNSAFASVAVENPSRMLNRRIYETIGIRYDDAAKMGVIVADVKKMLEAHPAIDQEQTLMVNFNAYAPSSLDFFIYTFTKTTRWTEFHEIKQDVLLKVFGIIESHSAEVAFPTSTLHMPQPLEIKQEENETSLR